MRRVLLIFAVLAVLINAANYASVIEEEEEEAEIQEIDLDDFIQDEEEIMEHAEVWDQGIQTAEIIEEEVEQEEVEQDNSTKEEEVVESVDKDEAVEQDKPSDKKPQPEKGGVMLDVRTTPFFAVERTAEIAGHTDSVDLLAWKSKQRVVFTLTNPVETHQITVLNFTVNVLDQQGKPQMDLPPVRFGDIELQAHKTRSVAYEFRIQGANLEEEELYTFEVAMGFKETEIGHAKQQLIENAFNNKQTQSNTIDREQGEQDYIMVLLQYDFVVGEIEEEADFMLTFTSIVLSILVIVIGSYLCWHGLIIPQCKNLKEKFGKSD